MTEESPDETTDAEPDSQSNVRPEWAVGGSVDRTGGIARPEVSRGVPDFQAAREHVLTEIIRFASQLRATGATVPITGGLDAARALAVVGLSDRERVESAMRASLIAEETDLEAFDEYFPTFWHRLRTGIDRISSRPSEEHDEDEGESVTIPADVSEEMAGESGDSHEEESDAEVPDGETGDSERAAVRIRTGRRHATGERPSEGGDEDARRFSTSGDRSEIDAPSVLLGDRERAAIDRFVDALSTMPGRREQPSRGQRGQVDARRALRAALETGGAPVVLPRRERADSERRVCLLLDVSGSVLDTIDRATLLAFAERVHERSRRGRVFLFDDEFADVTAQFDRTDGDPAATLREASVRWGGGTRIGAAMEAIRTRNPDAVDRDTVLVVVSDGLDVGDDAALESGITWLATRAGAIVWLNPLAVAASYEPATKGMRTCLPYIDALFGFATPADLAEAARQLEQRGLSGAVGYEHDPRRFEVTGSDSVSSGGPAYASDGGRS
ncbi:VWA domain-containing protein [Halobacteria archaeon AArc-dxtr1]|nr:VWA domain-containing protein [Halobacteria archaeon AArc-dxtr1]